MKNRVLKLLVLPFRLVFLAFVNPHGLKEVLGVANKLSENYFKPDSDPSSIPVVSLTSFAEKGATMRAKIVLLPALHFSVTTVEALTLAVLVRFTKATQVFEFGTHRGVSTTQLAANLEDGGKVTTLDLPLDFGKHQLSVDNSAEIEVAQYKKKGEMIPDDLRARVDFLSEDSASFNPAPYAGLMDMVFVDAAHTFDYVKNDSEKAWVMLRPGGMVVWHDCRPQSPDVVRYLRGCSFAVKRIDGTTLAFAEKISPDPY